MLRQASVAETGVELLEVPVLEEVVLLLMLRQALAAAPGIDVPLALLDAMLSEVLFCTDADQESSRRVVA